MARLFLFTCSHIGGFLSQDFMESISSQILNQNGGYLLHNAFPSPSPNVFQHRVRLTSCGSKPIEVTASSWAPCELY